MGSKQYDRLSLYLNQYSAEHADQNMELKQLDSQLASILTHNKFNKTDLFNLSKDLLPPLAQLEQLPKMVVSSLVKLSERTDDPKSARMAHYLLQAALGVGCGGTPMPPKMTSKGLRSIVQQADLESTNYAQLWRRPQKSEGAGMEVVCALRHLAAWTLSSGKSDEYAKVLGQCLAQHSQAAAAAEKRGVLGFIGGRSKETQQKMAQLTKTSILHGALSALRIGMSEPSIIKKVPKIFEQSILLDRLQEGVGHSDSRIARHSMAVLCQIVDWNEKSVLEIVLPCLNQNLLNKNLPGMGDNSNQETPELQDKKLPPQLNVEDSLCRMYLAKLLGKLLFCSMVGGNVESKRGTVIYMALTVLATRDPSYTVSMEAIAAMSGATILKDGSLSNQQSDEERAVDKIDVDKVAAAWQILEKKLVNEDQKIEQVLNQPDNSTDGNPHQKQTFAVQLLKRIISAATHESAGEVCCACNAMCALMKARTFSLMQTQEPTPPQVASILNDIQSLLWSLVHSQATVPITVRCSALCALVWCQDCLSPEQLYQIVRGGYDSSPWSSEFSMRVLEQLQQQVAHVSGDQLMVTLRMIGGLFSGAPNELKPDLLGDSLSLIPQKDFGRQSVVFQFMNRFIFEVESEGQQSGLTALKTSNKRVWARNRQAIIRLQCYCVWWLGEHVKTGSGDQQVQNLINELSNINENIPYSHFLAQQQKYYPVLSITINSLATCISVGIWEVKFVALKALALLAVRSREPFRFQCYTILKNVANNPKKRSYSFFHNKHLNFSCQQNFDDSSLASVANFYVKVLDQIYRGALVIQELVRRYGSQINRWPEKTEEAVLNYHDKILQQIQQCISSNAQIPLGERCAVLLDLYGDTDEQQLDQHFLERQKTLMQVSESQAQLNKLAEEEEAAKLEDIYAQQVEEQDIYVEQQHNQIYENYQYGYDNNNNNNNNNINVQPQMDQQDSTVQQGELMEDYIEYESGMPLPQDAIVVYSFEGENAGELTVVDGEEVQIQDEQEGGWLTVQSQSGSVGLVPQYYLKIIIKEETRIEAQKSNPFANLVSKSLSEADYDDALNQTGDWQQVDYNDAGQVQGQGQGQGDYQQVEGEEEIEGLVAFDFFAETPGEMTVYAGEYVKIIAQVDEDWYQVEKSGDIGFVPVTFIELTEG